MAKMDNEEIAKAMRRASRKMQLPQGGRHGTKKGGKGYTRKVKHKGLTRG